MSDNSYTIEAIGVIRSELIDRKNAPRQGDEGGYEAWVDINANVVDGLVGINVGDELLLLTWLHQAQRDVLQVHPRGNPNNAIAGVFATRSPDRPNPIGLHRVTVLAIDGQRLKVGPIEAIDGTPIVDIKPVLGQISDR